MFETIMSDPLAIARHRSQPLAREREEFLRHLRTCGTGSANIRITACYLLQIVRLLRLKRLRDVTHDEIDQAARRWGKRHRGFNNLQPGPYSTATFAWMTRRWFRFAGRLRVIPNPQAYRAILTDYIRAMSEEQGLSDATIRGRRFRAASFLAWYGDRHKQFRKISVSDVDAYLFRHGCARNLVTRSCEASTLRSFFRYAEARKLCRAGFAAAIKSPLIRRDPFEVRGPNWDDVERLLRSTRGSGHSEIRAHALLRLFTVYGIRNSEAVRLRLADIDWVNKTLRIHRGKRGGIHHFPLRPEAGNAIQRYLRRVRPDCSCPNVFVTMNGPYRPLIQNTVSAIINSRMKRCGVKARWLGPQGLRHACATRLLSLGTTFTEIADFLGHRDMKTVQVYAKLDARSLRKISDLDLVAAL